MALAALLAGCTQEPAALEFETPPPKTIETLDAVELPKIIVKDADGEPLKEQPSIEWSSKPEGALQVAGKTLSPTIKSGKATLIAKVKGSDVKLEIPITLQIVDRIILACEPDSCRFAPGDRFRLRAKAMSGDEVVEGLSFEWSSENPNIVEAKAGGEFEAKATGVTKLQAAARGVTSQQAVFIESPVDQLVVICPNPPQAYVAPSASGTKPSCVVKVGDTVQLVAEVRGLGEVMDRRPAYSSTNPTYVNVSSARVSAVQEGAAIVEARVENLFVAIPVEARRSVGKTCEGSFEERTTTTLGDEERLFACADADASRCLETEAAKLAKKSGSSASLISAARTCCCAAIPKLGPKPEAPAPAAPAPQDAGPAAADDAGSAP